MALSYAVLRDKSFRRLLSTRVLGIFGLQAQAVIVGWQIYTLTKDPLMLGLVGLTEAIPAIIFSLFSGHIVDNSRPHRVFLRCLAAHMLISSALVMLAGGLVQASTSSIVIALFVGTFLSGIARSFIMPASFTLLSQMVPRHQATAAAGWMSSGFQLASIAGPAIAGIVYGGYGPQVAWFLPVLFIGGSIVALWGIDRHYHHYRGQQKREPALKSIAAGWRFVWHSKVMFPVMLLDMLAVLFGGAVAILPVFADTVLHIGSEGLGLLRAAPALGAGLTALYFALKPMKIIRARTLLLVTAGFGAAMIGFGLSSSFLVAAFFLAMSGAFDSVRMVIRSTLMQIMIPEEMRGRVSALNGMFIISSNEIGAFESGLAASVFGLVPSILIGGSLTLVVVGVTAAIAPKLRKLVVDTTRE